jgi:hypothetical protein
VIRRDGIAQPWGTRTSYGAGEPWPIRVDSHLADDVTADEVDNWVPTAAVLHSNGDGMELAVKDGRIVGVRGRADHLSHVSAYIADRAQDTFNSSR